MNDETDDDLYWANIEADLGWADRRFAWLLDLIAWTCRQGTDPKPCLQAAHLPPALIHHDGGFDPFEEKLLRWLAFKDPIFFELARSQTADLVEQVGEDLAPEDFAFVVRW